MKTILVLLIILAAGTCYSATYYVDATGGSDSNLGTSTGAAWQTIGKVNGASFSAGDTVSFKKGETWSGTTSLIISSSGSAGNVITFNTYGSGNAPVITGTTGVGISVPARSYVTIDGLEVHTTGTDCISVGSGSSNVTISNSTLHACGQNGIAVWGTSSSTSNITITANTIYGAGTSHTTGLGNGIILDGTDATTRVSSVLVESNNIYSNGYDNHDHGIYDEAHQTIIRYNRFKDNTGFGVKFNAAHCGGSSCTGPQTYYNLIDGNGTGCTVCESSTSGPVGCKIWNNTCYGNGTVRSTWIAGLQYTIGTGTPSDNEWRNNIVVSTGDISATYFVLSNGLTTGLTASNNDYYSANAQKFWLNGAAVYTLAAWQAQISGDVNSIASDPLFVAAGSNYHITSSSPVRGMGISVGLSRDYDNNAVSGVPDVGYDQYAAPSFSGGTASGVQMR